MDVIDHLLPLSEAPTSPHRNQMLWFPEKEISVESFIVGALESTFHQMVLRSSSRFQLHLYDKTSE